MPYIPRACPQTPDSFEARTVVNQRWLLYFNPKVGSLGVRRIPSIIDMSLRNFTATAVLFFFSFDILFLRIAQL
jgi:hypothetical protein